MPYLNIWCKLKLVDRGVDDMEKIPTYKMVRELPQEAKVVKIVNGIELYNINVFQNIMSWNQHNLDTPALDYFGNTITYRELPDEVDAYAKGFKMLGIDEKSIVTMSLPVCNEYIISLFATTNMGAISNNVNFLFLRNNLARYTLEKKSDVLIILDAYLPLIIDQIKNSGIKQVILTSLLDYSPESQKKFLSDISNMPKKIREKLTDPREMEKFQIELANLEGVKFVNMRDIIELGKSSTEDIIYPEVDIERDSIYSYTSGTTAEPKCIVFKEQSPNAIIEMHKGLDLRDYVGDRSLLVIPSSHATGMFYATYLQMAKGKTLVLQPFYDKTTFATDLEKFKINHTLAAASFYLEAIKNKTLSPTALSQLTRPCSGGEPITKSNVILINEWLKEHGCSEKIAIGGGSGEVGSSALTSYELDPTNKTNETGYPIPGVEVKIVNPESKEPVKRGERGIIHITSAASADRYLDNEEATNEYYYYEDGKKWANLGDIAIQNNDGSYNMLGRSSDSYIDENGETHYLFDVEYALSTNDPVIEWEISAFKNGSKYDVVAQIVIKEEYKGRECEVIEYLFKKYPIQGVKIYDSFEVSEVTGKRDYKLLKSDQEGYISPYDSEHMIISSYINGKKEEEIIPKTSINTSIKTLNKSL